jgi:hypothetical protein
MDSSGRTIWIADEHRGDGRPFVVRADEKMIAFLELQAALHRRFEGLRWNVMRSFPCFAECPDQNRPRDRVDEN